jgi:ribose transport system substrate-binding protein
MSVSLGFFWKTAPPALLLLFIVLGCHTKAKTITFLPQETADDLWEPARIGAIDAARGSGYQIYWNGPSRLDDVQRQISLLDQAIRRRDEGIIIAPDQPKALIIPVLRAASAGVPTVVVGSGLPMPAMDSLSYVLNDEQQEGRIAAERICSRLHGKGSIIVLGVNPTTPGIALRLRSFQNAMHRECREVLIAAVRMGTDSRAQAESIAEEALTDYPTVNALFALTRVASLGAYTSLHHRHKDKDVFLIGCDQSYEELYYLSRGQIDAVIAQDTHQMAEIAIKMILAHNNGREMGGPVYISPVLLTKENIYSPQFAPILTYWRIVP